MVELKTINKSITHEGLEQYMKAYNDPFVFASKITE